LKPGPARRVDPGPGRPGAGTGPGWWKNCISHDPADLAGWPGDPAKPGQKLSCNSLTFVFFFTKTMPFWIFFKIGIDSADPVKTRWPGQNPEPGPWTEPGLKTLLIWEIGLKLWLPRRTILSFDLILDIMGFF